MPLSGSSKTRERKCIGFSEIYAIKRARQARKGPIPWVQRKLAVVAFIVVFNVLFLVLVWTYGRVVLTSPGYATIFISQSPPPAVQPQPPVDYLNYISSDEESIRGTPYGQGHDSRGSIDTRGSVGAPNPQDIHMTQSKPAVTSQPNNMEAGPMDAIPAVAAAHVARQPSPERANSRERTDGDSGLPPPLYSRRPRTDPVLLPEHRYCRRDEIIKPMRARHCRACDTCVLKYDHHCPWIGQCVGAFNQKFFVNFLQWSTIFTTFIFVSLLVRVVRTSARTDTPPINPQHIVFIVISAIFIIFIISLLATQVHLILYNMTTVEYLGVQRMRERERSVLAQMTEMSCCGPTRDMPDSPDICRSRAPWNSMISRRRILKQWDAEWGRIGKEGNLWWLGSKRANWQATMGSSKWGWIFPVGRSSGDGLVYPRNPRFDNEGRWRRRAEWPAGLQ
ncbi:zf-DHHC-domain-containing protein [Hysterangium stoloniferum]|nr:zf-DHHC-domain-containing protein [Hysterangium stoloniferum]